MKNPEDLENNYSPEAPPPYYQVNDSVILNPPTVFNAVPSPAPAPTYQQNVAVGGQPSGDIQLETILGQNDRFILQQMGTVGCIPRPAVVQIQDGNRQLIMSTVMDPGTNVGTGDHQVRTRSKVNFLSASGNCLMTVTETAQSMTVESGNRMLGIIDGTTLFPKLVPKSIAGVPVCSLVKDSSGSFYTFIGSNGSEIGKAGYMSGPGTFEVRLSSSVDPTTKPLLLTTGYLIYMLFYVETACGPIGMSGVGKRMCVCFLLIPIVFFPSVLTIMLSLFA